MMKAGGLAIIQFAKKLDRVIVLSQSEKKVLKRNQQFKDKHKGQRAFVIVNGPSLAHQDIEPLSNEITFAVSGFFKHEVIKKWQPTYYSICDPLFFNGSEQSFSFFKEMRKSIDSSTFFFPLFAGYKANTKLNLTPLDKTFYIASAGQPNSNIDMTSVVQGFQSVSSFALAQAIYMGCSPIYLLGFDHDWLAHRGMDRHFYKGGILKDNEANTKTLAELYTYESELKTCLKLWKNYQGLNRAAKKRGIKIYNATQGGYLDVFERAQYEEVIKNIKR